MAKQEERVRRIRYPRYISPDGLIRPYIPHDAMGLYIFNVMYSVFDRNLFVYRFFQFSATQRRQICENRYLCCTYTLFS